MSLKYNTYNIKKKIVNAFLQHVRQKIFSEKNLLKIVYILSLFRLLGIRALSQN